MSRNNRSIEELLLRMPTIRQITSLLELKRQARSIAKGVAIAGGRCDAAGQRSANPNAEHRTGLNFEIAQSERVLLMRLFQLREGLILVTQACIDQSRVRRSEVNGRHHWAQIRFPLLPSGHCGMLRVETVRLLST
jgi:hypothetical protein